MLKRRTGSGICPGKRMRIFKRDGCVCQYCGKLPVRVDFVKSPSGIKYIRLIDADTWKVFEVDHCIPRSNGGTHDDSNLRTACAICNNKKSNKIYGE